MLIYIVFSILGYAMISMAYLWWRMLVWIISIFRSSSIRGAHSQEPNKGSFRQSRLLSTWPIIVMVVTTGAIVFLAYAMVYSIGVQTGLWV